MENLKMQFITKEKFRNNNKENLIREVTNEKEIIAKLLGEFWAIYEANTFNRHIKIRNMHNGNVIIDIIDTNLKDITCICRIGELPPHQYQIEQLVREVK